MRRRAQQEGRSGSGEPRTATMERGGKRRINRKPEVQDNTKTVPPKSPKQKSPKQKKMLIPPEISAILKEPEDLSQDYNEEDYFDPPFHSTAVYAEGEEPLEKEVSKEKSLKQQLLITSWTQQKSKIVATPRSESRKVRNRTVQDKIIQKTPKATKKAKSRVPDAELPHAVESPNTASPEATRPPPISPKENRQGKHTNKSLISRKALSKVKECAPTSGKKTGKAALASPATPKAKTKRRKSIQPQTSHTAQSPAQAAESSRVTNSEDNVVEEEMNASRVPPKSSRRRRKSSNLAASKRRQSGAKGRLHSHRPGSENSESEDQVPSKEPHRRPSNKDVTSNNAESQVSEDEASRSVCDNSAGLSQTLPNKNKRKPNGHQETPKKGQDKSPERKRKKLNINDLHTTVANKAVSKKVWSSTEVPRSSRDMNELDVVLFECEKVYEEYRETVDSNVDIKAIDLFFASYKEQLTTSIEDVQKLKNIKKKNAKMQLEIGRKKKRLIEVKGEVIENESKLKQLQKTYEELQEKQSALKKAKEFLSGLGELRKDYLKFREENPEAKETYGMSSLPALLLQSQTIMNAEKHLHDINATLQSFIAGEKDVP